MMPATPEATIAKLASVKSVNLSLVSLKSRVNPAEAIVVSASKIKASTNAPNPRELEATAALSSSPQKNLPVAESQPSALLSASQSTIVVLVALSIRLKADMEAVPETSKLEEIEAAPLTSSVVVGVFPIPTLLLVESTINILTPDPFWISKAEIEAISITNPPVALK